MRMYAINESEVTTISSYNAQATAYFSLASFLLSASVSIFTNGIFYSNLTPAGQVAENYAAPILVVIAAFFAYLGVSAIRNRSSLWENIKRETS
jgi:hypothetical protein